jgi:hypothetical protein
MTVEETTEWHLVESSNVVAVAFEAQSAIDLGPEAPEGCPPDDSIQIGTIYVAFKRRDGKALVYAYDACTEDTFIAVKNATSVGTAVFELLSSRTGPQNLGSVKLP